MWYLYLSLLLFTCSHAKSVNRNAYDCLVENFENTTSIFNSNTGACSGLRSWIKENYTSTDIEPINFYANSFLRPDTSGFSCMVADNIPMSAGGIVELNVYMNLGYTSDYIRLIAYETRLGQNPVSVGELNYNYGDSNFNQSSWNKFTLQIRNSSPSFLGQIVISGRAASPSSIMFDSFRYLLPSSDLEETDYDDVCPFYNPRTYQCIEYDFGPSFDVLFDNTNEICTGAGTWRLVQGVNNTYNIQPSSKGTPSCVSTPPFSIPSRGLLSVHVSIKSESYFDTILVAMTDDKDIIHSKGYNKLVTNGFQANSTYELKLELEDIQETYETQITFVGFETEEATIEVQSFRFEPTSWDQDNCRSLTDMRKQFVVGK